MTKDGQKYYLHYDQVGSLRAVSDGSHSIVKEISYDTYGNVLADSNEAFTLPFGFAGGLYDKDTKLTRFGYRDYDAYTGKWTAKDPIDFGGGDSNLYGYVLGDPVNFVDPTGKFLISGSVIVTGAVVGAVINIGIEIALNGVSLEGIGLAAATGALGGLGGTSLALTLALGGLANFLSNGIQQLGKNSCGEIDGTALATSTLLGVLGAGAGAGISKLGNTSAKGGKAFLDNLAKKGTTVISAEEVKFATKYGITRPDNIDFMGNLIGGGIGAISPID